MRYVKYAFLAAICICLVTLALANRGWVTLRLLPSELERVAGLSFSVELPLFLVILGGIAAGLLIGFVWEWFREHRHRSEAAKAKRQAARMEREVSRLQGQGEEDDVLALLEASSKAR